MSSEKVNKPARNPRSGEIFISLTGKIESMWVASVGNRVTLASYAFFVPSTVMLIGGFDIPFVSEISEVRYAVRSVAYAGNLASLAGILATEQGRGTLRVYNRTKAHIARHGHLDERFARTVFEGQYFEGEQDEFRGYCQNQGMYLATKKGDRINFRKWKKRYFPEGKLPNV